MTIIRKLLVALAILIGVAILGLALFARGVIGGDAVRRTLEAQLSTRLGEPVAIARLGASFFPRVTLDLHDVSIGQPARATVAELAVATGLRGLFSRRVEDAEIILSNSRLPADMILGLASAAAQGGPSAQANDFTIASIRTLVLRNVELVVGTRALKVDLQASITGDRLDVTRLVAQSSGTELDAHGVLTSIAAHKGQFTASAGRLNLDELLAVASGLSSPAAARTASPVDVSIDLTAPAGALGGFRFEKLASTVRVAPGRLRVNPLRFGMFAGAYDGQLEVSLARSTPDIAVSGRVQGMDVSTMLQEATGSSSMSGRLGGTFSLTTRGTSEHEMLAAARGAGNATIADGEIPRLAMVRSIVLAFGRPAADVPATDRGSRFTRIDSTFTIADQTMRSQNITFASPDFDMTGGGSVRLPSGAVDMAGNVVLSRELTAQAGVDLRRYAQENGRIVVPATITGTLSDPSVRISVAAAAGRALENEVKRRFKGLLDRIIK
jgi:uncharacterized protein involved in outer membrane biogenesis